MKKPSPSAHAARVTRGTNRRYLPYKPPFHYEALLATFDAHRIGRLERIENDAYHRLVEVDGAVGWITVTNQPAQNRLRLRVDPALAEFLPALGRRVRRMFDLDVDPAAVARVLGRDPTCRALLRRHPGLRVPAGWSSFEILVATILGQLVSVPRARAMTAQVIEICGRPSGLSDAAGPIRLFPRPEDLARADLKPLGSTGRRKMTLIEVARRVAEGELNLSPDQEPEEFTAALIDVPGIGPWTAAYVAMKVLRHADAFPATDLILARALERHPDLSLPSLSPWGAYAAVTLWHEYAEKLSRPKNKSK